MNSIDYAHLICWLGLYKHGVYFSKTQLQKLLFICYGLHLARTGERLFDDDTPKAWPFGPVFPICYRKYDVGAVVDLPQSQKNRFSEDPETLKQIAGVVNMLHECSASQLSEWSHLQGSPWAKTIFGLNNGRFKGWNLPISDDVIKEFFSNENWKYGL